MKVTLTLTLRASSLSSGNHVDLYQEVEIPFSPFPGLELQLRENDYLVETVRYDVESGTLYLDLEDDFANSELIPGENLKTLTEMYMRDDGWKLSGDAKE